MIDATTRALAKLRAMNAGELSQGLSPENATACLHQAIRPLNATSLASALKRCEDLPKSIAIVVPAGVFTTPIEWTAIAVAGGCSVHLKAPAADPSLCRTLSETFSEEQLPVTWSTHREIPPVDAIIAFGADDTVKSISEAHPTIPVVKYGHRFSIAVVTGDPRQAAGPLAIDVARYDGRGCMAPTAVFTTGNADLLMDALTDTLTQMEQRYPRGRVEPGLGPEWRRRIGLAKVLGKTKVAPEWAITISPPEFFVPTSLPRMVNIHPVDALDHLRELLSPYEPWLSTLGTDHADITIPGIHRICRLGWMQAPSIPRNHDGRPMLSGL